VIDLAGDFHQPEDRKPGKKKSYQRHEEIVNVSGEPGAADAADSVEAGIESGNPLNTVVDHDGGMKCVTQGNGHTAADQIAGFVRIGQRDTKDYRTRFDKQVINTPGEIQSAERRISIEYFLQNFGTGAGLELSHAGFLEKTG